MKSTVLLKITRRLVLTCVDLVFLCALVALFLWGAARPAYAYVDPSVVTYAIQAVAGVAVALSAVIGVAWRKLRRFVFKVFHIDENAKKPCESRVSCFDGVLESSTQQNVTSFSALEKQEKAEKRAHLEEKRAQTEKQAAQAIKQKQQQEQAEKRARDFFDKVAADSNPAAHKKLSWKKRFALSLLTWKKRFALSLLTCFCVFFALLFVAPCEVLSAGSSELLLGVVDLWQIFAIATLAATIVVALILSLLRGRVFDIIIGIMAAIAVALCAQALFLNDGLPAANGKAVTWINYAPIATVSCVVWAALIVFAIVCACRRCALLRKSIIAACIVLICVQTIEVGGLLGSSGTYDGGAVATEDNLFSVSPNKNTIVFCLDTMDNDLIAGAKKVNPNLFDEFSGFTLYEDSVGSLVPTYYALPYLLTGETPHDDESYDDYIATRYTRSSLIQTIKDQDYSVDVYATYTNDNGYLADKADNFHVIDDLKIDTFGTLKALIKAACYRDMPWITKPKFRFYTDDLNNELIVRTGQDPANEPYLVNDPAYYEQLLNNKLTASDTSHEGAFRFIHLKGAHSPTSMNENAQRVMNGLQGTNRSKQIVGTFKIVGEYIKQLKELGLYDQTSIIITADHGDFEHDVETLTKVTSPFLMVKPAQSAEADSEPLIVSQAKTGHVDYPATLVSFVGGNSSLWGTPVWEATDGFRRRFYIHHEEWSKKSYGLTEYEVDGPVWEISSWKKTGKAWPREADSASD